MRHGVHEVSVLPVEMGDGIHVALICNCKRFVVSFPSTASLDGTTEGSILKRFEDSLLAEDHEGKDDAFYGVQDLVLDIGDLLLLKSHPLSPKDHHYPICILFCI
jgi:hypothetical protein